MITDPIRWTAKAHTHAIKHWNTATEKAFSEDLNSERRAAIAAIHGV